jgi:hypothetical protein
MASTHSTLLQGNSADYSNALIDQAGVPAPAAFAIAFSALSGVRRNPGPSTWAGRAA